MTDETDTASHSHTSECERRRREAALDETIEQSFPASDPPSTDPNPDSHTAIIPNGLDDQLKKGRSAMPNGMTSRVQAEAIWSIDLSVTPTDRVNQCWPGWRVIQVRCTNG